jgi:hypothetical protein
MIAVEKQEPVEVYLASDGSIVISQADSDAGPQLVSVRVQNVEAVIRALRTARAKATLPSEGAA